MSNTTTSRHELHKVGVTGGENTESFYMVIPKYMCNELGISKGDYLDIQLVGNKIVLTKLQPVKEQASS